MMEEELKLLTKYCIKYPHKPVLEFNTAKERQEWLEEQQLKNNIDFTYIKMWEHETYEEEG